MNARLVRSLIPLALTLMVGTAWGEPPAAVEASKFDASASAVPAEARNAAIRYLVAMLQNSRELDEKIAQIDFDACGTTHESQVSNPAFAAAAKAFEGHDLTPWTDASRLTKCDFEWPREQGASLLLPHLGKMRSEARILRFAARRELGEERPLEAAEHLATIVRMSEHVARDEIEISSLVGTAMISLSLSEMRILAESGRMNEAARGCMIAAIERLSQTDPCGLRRSMRGERELMLRGTMAGFTGPDAGRKLAAFIGAASNDGEATKVRLLAIADWNQERLEAEIARVGEAFDAFEAAWDSPDASEAIAQVEQRISRDEFGTVAALLCPSMSSIHASSQRLIEDIASTLSLLRAAKAVDQAPAAKPASAPASK